VGKRKMKLLIIRHGRAEDRDDWAATGAHDDARPLTAEGRELMRLGATGLHSIVESIDVLATSPLVRAQQTARIVADAYGIGALVEIGALRSDAAHSELFEWLCDMEGKDVVAIVGHNNHLEEFASWLLTGKKDRILDIKKGAALMIELRGLSRKHVEPDRATLLWALRPGHMRGLAG
jgi:phosphohistidine phosphatase